MNMEEKKSFEQRMARLNEIVAKVEGEALPLSEAMALYQEGQALIKSLQEELSDAEKKIGELSVSESDIK